MKYDFNIFASNLDIAKEYDVLMRGKESIATASITLENFLDGKVDASSDAVRKATSPALVITGWAGTSLEVIRKYMGNNGFLLCRPINLDNPGVAEPRSPKSRLPDKPLHRQVLPLP